MGSRAAALAQGIADLEIVDAHEHLWPEQYHLQHEQDVLTLIQYSLADLEVAGATPDEVELLRAHRDGPKAPLDRRWEVFRKYLPLIRHTAPIRALFIALRDIYGVERLGDDNYQEVSVAIQAARKPGLYERAFRQRCKIRHILNQNPENRRPDGLLLPIRNLNELGPLNSREALDDLGLETGTAIGCLDDLRDAIRAKFDKWQSDGTVGVKRSGTALSNPTDSEAAASLQRVRENAQSTSDAVSVQHFAEHQFIEEAGRRGMPVCVHTGLWAGTWADMRLAHPENLIPIALKHRETQFDVYHAGLPWPSTVGIMGRQSPNLWLNLCWVHVISPVMARRTLDEWLDVMPHSKIIGWGADYWMSVEKVYGHLVMARENIAEVLDERIGRGLMTEGEAMDLAEMMLRRTPERLYGLD